MIGARTFALLATTALVLGACHRRDAGAATLDAAADARARTAAKTLADLQAAEQASAAPLAAAPAERAPPVPSPAPIEREPAADEAPDAASLNEATPDG